MGRADGDGQGAGDHLRPARRRHDDAHRRVADRDRSVAPRLRLDRRGSITASGKSKTSRSRPIDAAKGESPATILPALIRKYPNVYVVRDFANPESAKLLLNEINDDRLVLTTIQAKDAPETLLRMLQKRVPQREFAKTVTAVMCTRLIRKLCEKCKVGYQPTPDLAEEAGFPGRQGRDDLIAARSRKRSKSRARSAAASDSSVEPRSSSCSSSTTRSGRFCSRIRSSIW